MLLSSIQSKGIVFICLSLCLMSCSSEKPEPVKADSGLAVEIQKRMETEKNAQPRVIRAGDTKFIITIDQGGGGKITYGAAAPHHQWLIPEGSLDWEAIQNQVLEFGDTDSLDGHGWCYIALQQDIGERASYDVSNGFVRNILLQCYEAALSNPSPYATSSREELEKLGSYLREPI